MKDAAALSLKHWQPRESPGEGTLKGRYTRLEPLAWPLHRDGLYAAVGGAENAAMWDYMALGPFLDAPADFQEAFEHASKDWRVMVICDAETDLVLGMASFMRLREAHGSAEIGCVAFGQKLRRTRAGTEAVFLLASHVFDDLGYRRLEWKCDNGNAASLRAASRFGFIAEGVFRQDMVIKGRNRDTAWFSITDGEWPECKAAVRLWLQPSNFSEAGEQKTRLQEIRAAL